jgi:hypothetical protein
MAVLPLPNLGGLLCTTLVIERNGTQRYLLQYEHVKRRMSAHRAAIVPHGTQTNKADPERGVESRRDIWRCHHGRT